MQMRKYKLGDIATLEISGVDKKIKDGEEDIRLCNFVDVYYNWAITMARHDSFMLATARPNEISKFQLKKGQVALTKDSETRDDIGISTYIADDFDDVILGYHCALITPNKWRFRSKGPQKTDDYFGVKPPKKDPIINKKGRELGSRASIFRSIATQLS